MLSGRGLVFAAAVAAFVFQSSTASADLPGPKRSRHYMATFVPAFAPCTSPNDSTTGAIMLPACSPAVLADPGCTFGPKGRGTGMGLVLPPVEGEPQDVSIRGRLVGLNEDCEGETMCVTVSAVVSTVGCQSGDADGCTMQTLTDFPLGTGCGVVKNGKVKLRTTVNTAFGAEVLNSRTVIQIRGVGVRRTSSVNSPAPSGNSFESGLFTK
jgi:hypothetical protein